MTNRALIVIDVQNEYVTGNLPIAYPPLAESVANIGAAMDAADAAGIPVVLVQHVAPETSPIFARGSEGFDLHASVASRRRDLLVEKTLPSSFTGTGLAEWLTERGVDTVVVCGYLTQNCDESTARDAVHRGFAVEFLSDATGAVALANAAGRVEARDLHEAVLTVMQSRYAAVATTAAWVAVVKGGGELERGSIHASAVAGRE